MSFIDLMKNDIWSDADIVNRTEAMISSEFPKASYDILMRKVQGVAFGYTLTAHEQSELQRYQSVSYHAGAEAAAARADMDLLHRAMRYEEALLRLSLPVTDQPPTTTRTDETGVETTIDNPLYLADRDEREAAQTLVNAATTDVTDLHLLRNPPQPDVPII